MCVCLGGGGGGGGGGGDDALQPKGGGGGLGEEYSDWLGEGSQWEVAIVLKCGDLRSGAPRTILSYPILPINLLSKMSAS